MVLLPQTIVRGRLRRWMVGAVAGGFVSSSTARMQSPLWVVGGLELAIAGAWEFGRLLRGMEGG